MKQNQIYYSGNFYVSGSVCDNWNYDYWDGAVPHGRNLRNLITMELGKIYGMINDVVSGGGNCSGDQGIMNDTEDPLVFKELSLNDKCKFMSLYCPELTPVIENIDMEQGTKLDIMPNPSDNTSVLKLSVNKPYFNVKIDIYDRLGRNVKTIIVNEITSGMNTLYLNNTDMISGIYTYRIVLDNTIINERIIISK